MNTRIQRSRQRGNRLPPGAVVITRPGPWGNPFRMADARWDLATRKQFVIDAFRYWLMLDADGIALAERARHELRGKTLACWCPLDGSCHYDALKDAIDGTLWKGIYPVTMEGVNYWIKVTATDRGFYATVYCEPSAVYSYYYGNGPSPRKLNPYRHVIGIYGSIEQAIEMAKCSIGIEGPMLCTLPDIDQVRRENACHAK